MLWLFANWRLVLGAAAITAAFSAGWWVNGSIWEGKLARAQQVAEKHRQQLADDSARIIKEANKKEAKIVYRTKIVYKDIARINGPAMCIDDERVQFVARWNEIAGEAGGADAGLRGAGDAGKGQ